jgi:hypothetical protein
MGGRERRRIRQLLKIVLVRPVPHIELRREIVAALLTGLPLAFMALRFVVAAQGEAPVISPQLLRAYEKMTYLSSSSQIH